MTIDQFWSKKHNIHFGYYRLGDNPFRLEAMLSNMNAFVGQQLGLPLNAKAKILDLGCGYGATMAQLQAQLPTVKFTGINSQPAQLNKARQIAPDAQLVCCNFEAMPFQNDGFDAAYALETACFAKGSSKPQFLFELARVLRPGARLVVLDGFRKHDRPLPPLIERLYRACILAWGMDELPSLPAFQKELERQGFIEVVVQDLSWRIAPSLAHIPIVALRLWLSQLRYPSKEKSDYLRALCITFVLSVFKRHFGYYAMNGDLRDEKWEMGD